MTPTARRLPPEQRRAQLAQAALAVAAEQGYAGLSLDEVGERAGVTRNLLYHYFPRGGSTCSWPRWSAPATS